MGKVWSRTRCVYECGDSIQGRGDQPCLVDERGCLFVTLQCPHVPHNISVSGGPHMVYTMVIPWDYNGAEFPVRDERMYFQRNFFSALGAVSVGHGSRFPFAPASQF